MSSTPIKTKYVVERRRRNGQWVPIASPGFRHEGSAIEHHCHRQFAVVERWGREAMSAYRVVRREGVGRKSRLRRIPDVGVGSAGVYLLPDGSTITEDEAAA